MDAESSTTGYLAEVLTRLRQSQGLAITTLAERANISRQHIWRLEKGLARDPGCDVLSKLAAALGVGISELLPPKSPPAPVLATIVAHAPRLEEEDWRVLEGISAKLSRRPCGTPPSPPLRRLISRQPRTSQGRQDGWNLSGDTIPDDIKVIAQFLAEREGDRVSWQHFSKAALDLKRQLQKRS